MGVSLQKLIVLGGIFSLGIVAGILFASQIISDGSSGKEERLNQGYQYINPLLECSLPENESSKEVRPIEDRVGLLINELLERNDAKEIGVYFRDLNNGPWFGINEDVLFTPASLLKVAVMMSYYKKAESDPSLLSQTLEAQAFALGSAEGEPTPAVAPGKKYTVEQLIESMIVGSDNNAMATLTNNNLVRMEELRRIYTDLNLSSLIRRTENGLISVRTYSSFFRILYNASYLDKRYSEKALELLTRTVFKEGLRKGVPPSVKAAHKFGIRYIPDSGVSQLHDCGVVYYPKHPYLLCIMTRGDRLDRLPPTIATISELVYNEIDKLYGNQ